MRARALAARSPLHPRTAPPLTNSSSFSVLADDYIPPSGGFPDPFSNMTEDMGLTPALQKQLSDSYVANMARVYAEVLERGMFSWQQLWKCVRRRRGRAG